MTDRRRVLLVGATGTFGRRLAALLADIEGLEIVLAARRRAPCDDLARALTQEGAKARFTAAAFDRDRPEALVAMAPWLVVDTAGPFQGVADRPPDYRFARAAVACGAHYVDIADGRAFVEGFPAALDEAARGAGVLAVTGASSTPALSQAALAELTAGWRRIDDVTITIAPGVRAPRGLSVMQAILSYVGRPVRVFRSGAWTEAPGWSATRRVAIPGLGSRLASLCETPDLDLVPARFPVRDEALFLAGLELPIMHHGLGALGLLVRAGIVRDLRPWARPLGVAADALTWMGSDRGGMLVEATGYDGQGPEGEGRRVRASWSLVAEANAGPSTPAAPAAALVRALAEGRETRRGAAVAAGMLPLAAIVAELRHLPITTRIDSRFPDGPGLFRQVLGQRFEALPVPVRAIHGGDGVARGTAVARRGRSPIARLVAAVLGLPRPGRQAVEVTIATTGTGEVWTRRFGDRSFASRLGAVSEAGQFEERFGPLAFRFEMVPRSTGVAWRTIGWSAFRVPLPRALRPVVRAASLGEHGRYRFRVVVADRLFGLMFAYRGTLAAAGGTTSPEG